MTTTATQTKTAIVILSDPEAGDEALGRLFNGLATAYEFKSRGGEVSVQFQGAGTRWPERLIQPEHPAYALFQQLKEQVAGASCACAELFGADLEGADVPLLQQLELPGTSGLAGLYDLHAAGYAVLTF